MVVMAVALILALAASASLFAGKKADLSSHWRDRDIVIDGVSAEWQGMMTAVKDAPLSMGVFNDDQYLYLCLVSGNRAAAGQIHRQGLIVWLDKDGGKKKQFGFEFPIPMRGMSLVDRDAAPPEEGRGTRAPGQGRGTAMPLEADEDRAAILGPGKDDRHDLALDELKGIAVKLGDADGVLVYELRMPLRASADVPYAASLTAGTIVGVSVETPEFRQPAGRSAGGGGGSPGMGGRGGMGGMGGRGGMGGMGGRGGTGGGGREGGRSGAEMPTPIKFSTTVQLATAH
jgi:hypothetical protein